MLDREPWACACADLDGDNDVDKVSASFALSPPFLSRSRVVFREQAVVDDPSFVCADADGDREDAATEEGDT